MLQLTLALSAGSVALLATYLYRKLRRPYGFPPGPRVVPILGSIPFLNFPSDAQSPNIFEALSKLADIYGPVCSFALGHSWIVIINDYATLKEAMVKNSIALAGRKDWSLLKYENPYYPQHGILNETYSTQWKLQRSTALQVLRRLGYGRDVTQTVITEEAEIMTETFKGHSGRAIDIQDHISSAVSNVIISLLFGKRYDYENQEFKETRQLVEDLFTAFEKVNQSDIIPGAFLNPTHRKNLQWLKEVDARYIDLLQKKIGEIPHDSALVEPRNFVEGYRMEREKNPEIKNRLYQILSDFVQAGLETTNTTLGWSMFFMIKHPEVQKKVQEELDRVVGRSRKPTLADKDSLPYVEATLLETLRVGKTAPATLPHSTLEDTCIGGYTIPKGTEVWGNLWHILNDPELWPEPEVFKPERFLDSAGQVVKPEHFIPFGIGRRACMGEQLARQELFLFFSHLLHAFTIGVAPGETLPPRVGTVAITHHPPKFNVSLTCRD